MAALGHTVGLRRGAAGGGAGAQRGAAQEHGVWLRKGAIRDCAWGCAGAQ